MSASARAGFLSAPARAAWPDFAAAILTLLFAALCAAFASQPVLASFADDSVSYLILAQAFSPWQAESYAVADALPREAFYPPLFPLLLAAAGAAHDIARAHLATALILAVWVPLAYLLGVRWLGSRGAALGAALVCALLPGLWTNAKGILSEPLYGALLLALLLALECGPTSRARRLAVPALLSALVLTRTAGLALAATYALWALTRREPALARLRQAAPALAAFAAYGAWVLLRPEATVDQNVMLAGERFRNLAAAPAPFSVLAAAVSAQLEAIGAAWSGALILYWVDGRPLPLLLSALAGLFALAGLALRLRAGRPDGWMMAGFAATFIAWPFDEQMGRFLFPALPVLVLYAFLSAGELARALGRKIALAHALAFLLLASLTAPACVFLVQRARAPVPHAAMSDWYRTPNLGEAKARAEVHLGLLEDMAAIGRLTGASQRVMWVTPGYIALLADRPGVRAPASSLGAAAYLEAVRAARPDYVFLSRFHPRDTLSERAWNAGTTALQDVGRAVHVRARPDGSRASLLLKLE